jgi:hypothetical protein
MADITMCEGTNCPLRHNCYRVNAIPNEFRQSYFTELPYDKNKGKCNEYWPEDYYDPNLILKPDKNENK